MLGTQNSKDIPGHSDVREIRSTPRWEADTAVAGPISYTIRW